jgi:hypothetical protein
MPPPPIVAVTKMPILIRLKGPRWRVVVMLMLSSVLAAARVANSSQSGHKPLNRPRSPLSEILAPKVPELTMMHES